MKKKEGKEKEGKQKIDYYELINKNLHDLRLAADYASFQFTRLDLNGKGVEALAPAFKDFKFVEHIDLSNNTLADVTHLAALPFLITLNLERNNIKDFKAFNIEQGWKTLRTLNLSFNKIAELVPIGIPNLQELALIENKIEKVEGFGGHAKLRKLELRRNKVGSLQGMANLPELKHLYLSQNKVKSLVGLDAPNLKTLHLRKNNIILFEEAFPLFEQLTYLNLRENSIEKLEEILKTKDLLNLRELVFSQNPLIMKYEFYLFDLINANLRLTRINKVTITKGVKLRAFKHAQQKWRAAEDEKKKQQEEQKRKAEQAQVKDGD